MAEIPEENLLRKQLPLQLSLIFFLVIFPMLFTPE